MISEIGRLTQEVDVKTVTANGKEKHVVNNRLAIFVDKENTVYIDIAAWGGTADFIGKYLHKGDELFIEGDLRNKLDKIGDKEITIPYLLVTKIKFTHGKKAEQQ